MLEFDVRLPNGNSVSLANAEFSNRYLEREFYHLCEVNFDLKKQDIPDVIYDEVQRIIGWRTTEIVFGNDGEQSGEKPDTNKLLAYINSIAKAKNIEADPVEELKEFINWVAEYTIMILKIPSGSDFSILKISELHAGINIKKLRKRWHFNIFKPKPEFTLYGNISDVTKMIMPSDVRLMAGIITGEASDGKFRISQLAVEGDGAWGVDGSNSFMRGEMVGLFAISPRRSQIITTGLFLSTLAMIVCYGCVFHKVKIDIFDSDKPSTIWTIAIPVLVYIFTQLAVKDHSSSYFYNLITRKYRISLVLTFLLLIISCCWDDRAWDNPWFFSWINQHALPDFFDRHDIHPGWLTVLLGVTIFIFWLGFAVSYWRARPRVPERW